MLCSLDQHFSYKEWILFIFKLQVSGERKGFLDEKKKMRIFIFLFYETCTEKTLEVVVLQGCLFL